MGNSASAQRTANYTINQDLLNEIKTTVENEFVNIMINTASSTCDQRITAIQRNKFTIADSKTGDFMLENRALMTADCAIKQSIESNLQNALVQSMMNSFQNAADSNIKEAIKQKAMTDFGDIAAKVETQDNTNVNVNTNIDNIVNTYFSNKVKNQMENRQTQVCEASAFAEQENIVTIERSTIGNIVVSNGAKAAFKCMLGGDIVNKIVNEVSNDIKSDVENKTASTTDKTSTQDATQQGAFTALGNAVSKVVDSGAGLMDAVTAPIKYGMIALILLIPLLLLIFMMGKKK